MTYTKARKVRVADIITTAAQMWRVSASDITGKSRDGYLMRARQAVYYTAKKAGHSYPRIGAAVGGRDHSTVISGFQTAEERIRQEPFYARMIAELEVRSIAATPRFIQSEQAA